MFEFLKKRFLKKVKFGDNGQSITTKFNGKRILELDQGDAVLILKNNGTSTFIDSGSEQLSEADELIAMVWCYLANPEFVRILRAMFTEVIDEINADKMRDNMAIGRMGGYAKMETEEKGKNSDV